MGVTILQVFPDESRSGYKAVDRLQSRICGLGAVPAGMFSIDCETYYPISGISGQELPSNPKKLHIMHSSDTPVTTYSIIENGRKQVVLMADIMFDMLLPRLSHMYQPKKNLKIECKGNRFEVADFVVKVGNVTMTNGQYKGILVEVDYGPCVVPELCWNMMHEFIRSFMGSGVSSAIPRFFQEIYSDIYTEAHTMQQYLEKFNEFRESTLQQQGNQPN